MRNFIPGEMWNQIYVPTRDVTSTLISTYLSEVEYKLPSIQRIMLIKEFWHTVCEFSERCGALLERYSSSINRSSLALSVNNPIFGELQRFVGAGVNGSPVCLEDVSVEESNLGYSFSFRQGLAPSDGSNVSAYVDYSVVPNVNASPADQKVPLWFLRKYNRLLISGMLMRLYAMDGEQWTDAAAARMHATTYMQEINRVSHSLITSGMRKFMMVDAESILARQSTTTNSTTSSNTVG